MRLNPTLHDAIDAHLSNIADEAARHEALTYLRGLTTLLAITLELEYDRVTRRNETASQQRIDSAIRKARQRQLAAARDCIQTNCMGQIRETIPC
ncbi:hypothetical protein EPK84_18145 [Sinorhizobium fredii]|nr:hypothetical protein EPK84_18145 [Sinorhizobium fredii]